MIYITGDTHRDFDEVAAFCHEHHTTRDDMLIILGDAGVNYYGAKPDSALKGFLATLPITLFCIHGNHEMRPQKVSGYREVPFCGATAYVQAEYPNLVFAKDGEVYRLGGLSCLVCGGAYSVDKKFRLSHHYNWWDDEQPDDATKDRVFAQIDAMHSQVDVVLTHTCPLRYIPMEMFLSGVDPKTVDNSTEEFLDEVEEKTAYQKWYCGHFHCDKTVATHDGKSRIRFMFDDFCELTGGQDALDDAE